MSESLHTGNKRTFSRRLKEARIGDVAAQYEVALMYANGAGTAKNPKQAFIWTKVAAERGHVAAQYLLGCAYASGQGIEKDELQALKWLTKANDAGHGKAKFRLAKLIALNGSSLVLTLSLAASELGVGEGSLLAAKCVSEGDETLRDPTLGLQLYALAAQRGNAHAQFEYGKLILSGDANDRVQGARQWMRAAAAQGHPGARLALESLDERKSDQIQPTKLHSGLNEVERRNRNDLWPKFVQRQGSPDDAYDLGVMYAQGIGVDKNTRQARLWYRRAAEKGCANGQYAMGQLLEDSDPSQAIQWYREAAETGHADAQFALAKLLVLTSSFEQTPGEYLSWVARAAHNGNANAMFALSETAGNVSATYRKNLLESAAIRGHAEAQFALAEMHAQGEGGSQNWITASQWYQAAAEQEHPLAQCKLASLYVRGVGVRKDKAIAFAWYERASTHGLPQALWSLGELYAQGVAGVQPDPKKAAALCKRAANAGFAPAQSTMGTLFAKAARFDRAVHWWALAADQGDPEAMFNLAQMYRSGKGVVQDFERAFDLFFRAANVGLRSAQTRVGLAYATGEGVAPDLIEAAKWFEVAAQKGDHAAKANLIRARGLLNSSQAKEATRRAILMFAS